MKKVKVGIVGGSGYTGIELLRLLAQHPHAEILTITSRKDAGKHVTELFPSLRGRLDLVYSDPAQAPLKDCDVVFFATPHGVAMSMAEELTQHGVKVIDLAADFRLKDVDVFKKWYKLDHSCPDILAKAVYGQPETMREQMKGAMVLGMAGCYPTTIELGLMPLLKLHKEVGEIVNLDVSIIADSKSGISGAGRKADISLNCAEFSDNFKAYGVSGHRHEPEMIQQLSLFAGAKVPLTFIPHLLPNIRGIFSTIYVRLTQKGKTIDYQALYEKAYAGEHFIDVMPAGSLPETRMVRGSNMVRIALYRKEPDLLVILVVEDNLVKGSAGQSVQAMNLLMGLPESEGLDQIALVP